MSDEDKEFFSKEKNHEFFEKIKETAEEIANGTVEPMESFNKFYVLCIETFPKSSNNPTLRDMMNQRFQIYLQIWILRELGRLKRQEWIVQSLNFSIFYLLTEVVECMRFLENL